MRCLVAVDVSTMFAISVSMSAEPPACSPTSTFKVIIP
jgi:hypothetical protein